MGATSVFYSLLLDRGYSNDQLSKFKEIGSHQESGFITANQAHKQACANGFNNAEGDDVEKDDYSVKKGSFKDWLDTASKAGWIDTEGFSSSPLKKTKKDNTLFYAVVAIGVIGFIYYKTRKN